MNKQNFNVNDKDIVREAQDRLRSLGRIYDIDAMRIPSSGNYDSSTLNAVREFQLRNNLSATGEIDQATWQQLTASSDNAKRIAGPRGSISPYPSNRKESVTDGESSELVFISQLMLNTLSAYYDLPRIPLNGSFDEVTSEAVRMFQRKNMLPETGEIDPLTWDLLAEEYNLAVTDPQ